MFRGPHRLLGPLVSILLLVFLSYGASSAGVPRVVVLENFGMVT